jgi:hypothetical protein
MLQKVKELEERAKTVKTRRQQDKIIDELKACIDEYQEASMRVHKILKMSTPLKLLGNQIVMRTSKSQDFKQYIKAK